MKPDKSSLSKDDNGKSQSTVIRSLVKSKGPRLKYQPPTAMNFRSLIREVVKARYETDIKLLARGESWQLTFILILKLRLHY